ncbi:quorum-sensing phosphorelay protein LuxU [Vibrio vulnificus]|uniref:quorum-sensing phosphorelay protein LuxU n=1 Tax=Vibrio vulnificus TaxID=672 RepID=UPI000DAE2909|nr:quorum-sensing phosphorelay protein LuxU [Vibrio vulnificus]MDK2620066.1 Hpt domain-containing protein [Vibrio vulnificus]RAH31491.1 phosphorelay protein LuxU [Vibrio vulnificus]HDY7420757.1 Hpt domain-containing protein [Vibrio vulnificus]HDY7494445.1 Hpt domain-containing protein [Vibrio vulnificus]
MELLNQKKIASLTEEIGADNVPVLLEIFLSELESYLKVLCDATYSDKLVYLKDISHALKSSAASFGADALCHFAVEIDTRAKEGDALDETQDVVAMIDHLHQTQQAYLSWQANGF